MRAILELLVIAFGMFFSGAGATTVALADRGNRFSCILERELLVSPRRKLCRAVAAISGRTVSNLVARELSDADMESALAAPPALTICARTLFPCDLVVAAHQHNADFHRRCGPVAD